MKIDTHCHLDLYSYPEQIALESEWQNILTIAVTNLPSQFEIEYPKVLKFKKIRQALGLHPLLVENHTQKELETFRRLTVKTSYIGEIGLDFSPEGMKTSQEQIDSFRFALSSINDRPRFVSLHSRKAEERVLELLEAYKVSNAVFHWFSGSISVLDQIIKAGHYLSINPAMIGSNKGRKIIELIPMNRVLTETDGPHLNIRARPVKPIDIGLVLDYLAMVWNISKDNAERQVYGNFKQIIDPIRRSFTDKSLSLN